MSVSNSIVCHKWAHGFAAEGANMSTDGKKLWSYHTLVGFNTGRGLVFMSNSSMTPTTGKHLSHARRAISHQDVVHSPIFTYGEHGYGDFNVTDAFKQACDELNDRLIQLAGSKNSAYLANRIDYALDVVAQLNAIAAKYDLPQTVYTSLVTDRLPSAREYAAKFKEDQAKRQADAQELQFKRQEAQRDRDAAAFLAWCRGGSAKCPASYRQGADGSYYIAVHGDKVVTSGGAECPIEHARRGIEFWFARDNNDGTFKPWHRNGERVQLGVFQLDRIETDGTAYAGCHKFSITELNRLADQLL